jgi:hypothetical protein
MSDVYREINTIVTEVVSMNTHDASHASKSEVVAYHIASALM